MNKSENILVIAPHADDEILGCGGSIAGHVHKGDNVIVVIATNAHNGDPELFSKENIDMVRNEALNAHKILGVKKTIFLDFPAPALDSYPNYKISLSFNNIIKEFKPSVLYLPHPGDLHLDHKSIYESSLVSARPNELYSIKEILCYETPSETEWTSMQDGVYFKPNYFNNITHFFEKKIEAMKCYKTQLKSYPHPRSIEYLEGIINDPY